MANTRPITALRTAVYRTDDFASAGNTWLDTLKPLKTDSRCAAGILSEYADSTLTDVEKTAFEAAMLKKHEKLYYFLSFFIRPIISS